MKRTLVLLTALLLAGGMAWADGRPSSSPVAGACRLPDLAQVPAAGIPAAALAAGLEVTAAPATDPPCPTNFSCGSISNCGVGSPCSLTLIGPCCMAGKLRLCCGSGSIVKETCPCVCTSSPCQQQCTQSSNVTWGDCQ